MKKIFILAIAMLTVGKSKSQTIEDARKHIYYGRYETANNVLHKVITKQDASPECMVLVRRNLFETKQN